MPAPFPPYPTPTRPTHTKLFGTAPHTHLTSPSHAHTHTHHSSPMRAKHTPTPSSPKVVPGLALFKELLHLLQVRLGCNRARLGARQCAWQQHADRGEWAIAVQGISRNLSWSLSRLQSTNQPNSPLPLSLTHTHTLVRIGDKCTGAHRCKETASCQPTHNCKPVHTLINAVNLPCWGVGVSVACAVSQAALERPNTHKHHT